MKKLTLELVPAFQQRLKVVAARKSMRVPRYCQTVMDRVPRSEEASGVSGCFDRQAGRGTPKGTLREQPVFRGFG